MMKSERSEKTPLHISEQNLRRVKLIYPEWLSYLIVIAIPLLHLCSYALSLVIINQYSYYAFMKEKYPNETDKTEPLPTCTVNTSTTKYDHQLEIQKIASQWNIYCNLAYLIPALFMNINLATYSDVYGRKLFFIVPLVGSLLKCMLNSIGIYFEINIRLLLIFNMLEACTGSWIATLSMALCFISDTTETGKRRSFIIGVLEGCLGIGGFIATLISGYIIEGTDGFFYPEVTAAGIVGLGLLLVIFLQETLLESRKRQHVSIFENMKRVTECYTSDFSPKGKRWMFVILLLIFAMSSISNLGRSGVETLYQLNSPFCWNSIDIGTFNAVRAVCWNIGALLIIKVFHVWTSDEIIALVGCTTSVASLIVEGLADSGLMLYISAVVSLGCTVTMPMVRGIMSHMTPADKQGSVYAGVAAMGVFCALIGAVSINVLYSSTVDIFRGLTFLIWSVFGTIGIVLCIIFILGTWRNDLVSSVREPKQKVDDKETAQ